MSEHSAPARAALLGVAALVLVATTPAALAAGTGPAEVRSVAAARHSASPARGQPARTQETPGEQEAAGGEEAETGQLAATPSEGDVLAENGLASPSCGGRSEAPSTERENCATSGFAPAPEPTGNYAFDVHIDTGLAHFSNYLEAAVQDAAQWAWMALVALVHGLLVALEWCYSLNLLGGALLAQVAGALRGAQATFTTPGLAVVLAIASILATYHGLLRRHVAQTLGQVLATLAMMLAGLWTIVDPTGSVGMLAGWVDNASAGALGAVAAGNPSHPERTLAEDMRGLFADVVTAPWCFMEFGNVRWCRDPRLLDPRIERAALRIAAQERTLAAGSSGAAERARALAVVSLVERAQDNGELFLAFPANGPARNSINEAGSLLSVLCGGSSEATHCKGPTAPEAQFRTQQGTWPRVVGVLLIWLGALSMLALFGWLALRLIAAAALSLFLLLLAPVAVLAPALGDGGRGMFQIWAMRLLGAVTAKLVYSIVLGVTLLLTGLLADLTVLGWWTQWLLICAAWWLAFRERHELLAAARLAPSASWRARGWEAAERGRERAPTIARRVRERALHRITDGAVLGTGRLARRALLPRASSARPGAPSLREARRSMREPADPRALEMLEGERTAAVRTIAQAPRAQAEISAARAQLARVQLAREHARGRLAAAPGRVGSGAPALQRRIAMLDLRAQRIEREIKRRRDVLSGARSLAAESGHAREHGRAFSAAQLAARAWLLDEQAELLAMGRRDVHGERRDYRRLAALGGEDTREWDELDAERRRRAILRIDRALAERSPREPPSEHARGPDSRRAPAAPIPTRERAPAHERSSPLESWLRDERARADEPAPTLAERARSAAARRDGGGEGDAELRRRRRQFAREQREGLD